MNDFQGLLSSDYGFKPQGKAAPMAGAKSGINSSSSSSSANSAFNFEIGGSKTASYPSNSKNSSSSLFDDHDTLFRPNRKNTSSDDFGILDDVFATGGIKSNSSKSTNNANSVNLDSIFGGGGGGGGETASKFSSLPVFDKPVYDDEDSSSAKFENIFASASSASVSTKKGDAFDDLLGGLGKKEPLSSRSVGSDSKGADKGYAGFDDLLPGFGGGSASSTSRMSSDTTKKTSSVVDDPFVVLESTSPPVSSSSGIFTDPLDEMGNLNAGKKTAENSSGAAFDDIDPLGGFGKAVPAFSAEINGEEKEAFRARVPGQQSSVTGDTNQKSSVRSPERGYEKKVSVEDFPEPSVFEMPYVPAENSRTAPNASSPAHSNASFRESSSHGHASPNSEENMGPSDDIWLSVSEVPLFTHPTAAPPPSRPPPPRPARFSRGEFGSFPASNVHKKANDYPSFPGSVPNFQSPKSAPSGASGSFASPMDELEDFAMGRNASDVDATHASSDVRSGEDFDSNSVAAASAAAMKEAMDRAEAKFRHARGVRERESSKVSKNRESVQVEKEENPMYDTPEREFREHQERQERERQQKEREDEERRRMEEEERRRIEKEWEEKEREKRRIDKEREFGRQAVERAAKEARERAAVEARTRAERVAVQRAQAEARERAEKVAVQRAQAEARERAAAGAKERAEKAAADAREKAKAEAREKEAREREAKEKERERAASAARANQSKNENDLESFFSMGGASSAPRPRAASSDPFETQFQAKPTPETTRASVNSSSNMRKASSSTNIVDDLSSIFGGPPSSGDFQEVDGETEDRRRARMDRHHRTQERAAKALAEKNARDLEVQREQAERNRISETLDVEIRRWAAGKEGNLRALLSTMQYVLWPECGWQPVSLTDLITGAAVKKAYRKATLCIHPDKVQQKGATLQQKFVAEKVFDLLKEAWNKFNSEELF
ncbi:auxilin-related protein 2-like isoform X1 [Chenopodium quinoa]|uniref:auxilin-related protein 2-like isoform X1 n=1 Tax=Chenopodium quinoa TaxID=63459 RepID=UPI000B772202|nr:auxilin-related protein 2-like isoform X1 [Chenopodium quinoa]